jgi:hypothetical protein
MRWALYVFSKTGFKSLKIRKNFPTGASRALSAYIRLINAR